MKRRDFLLIGAVIVLAAIVLLVLQLTQNQSTPTHTVVIYVGNTVYQTVSLDKEQTIAIEQEDGRENTIELSPNGVRMLHANCKNQDCVKQGLLTLDNWNERIWRNWIICLPNQVSVELVVEEAQ